ncbi:MAG: hypothetical protein NPINA01_01360 [Nitrospinaceae bacterium]|nr:MAG: hypothetical protein NPINA01_01360 [Nitrospinaceae bacterium]
MSETLFKQVNYNLGNLIEYIALGEIGLPDLQRPFVWKNAKVRDLFDSIYHGFPVGYFLFWQNALADGIKPIGTDQKQKVSKLLIVDGQQRLTGLYAVIKGVPVVRENYKKEVIEIAFNPLLEKFEVADAAIRKDRSYISSISKIWGDNTNIFALVRQYLENLKASREIEAEEEERIQKSFSKLINILSFPFTALELSGNTNEEQAQEVFVRINSKGKPLNQADFILTLMSVFWDEGRKQLEKFCQETRMPSTGHASPFNYFIEPDPNQLLRVAVGLGFKRARLKYVYSILRGKDLQTETFSEEIRIQQFEVLKKAQEQVLNLQYWHDFMKVLIQAGYRNGRMISSENNLLFCYTLYLKGRIEYKVEEFDLRQVLARWFFMSSMTGRYTSSPESTMESDLARFRDVKTPEEFLETLKQICDETLTRDFWEITLPNELATSSPLSPSLFAYFASLNLLEAKVLFSNLKVSELCDPTIKGKKSSLERHHLFPKAYLKSLGISDTRDINQIANYALVEWGDNVNISDQIPAQYFPNLKERFSLKKLERMCYWHALPDDWENLEYRQFLIQRRELMAKVISDGYHKLCSGKKEDKFEASNISIEELVSGGETTDVEFKSTLRTNLHTGEKDPRMEYDCLRTIAGLLNRQGGKLIIGVADDGDPVGIEIDGFLNEDKIYLHLVNIIKERLGSQFMLYIHPRFDDYQEVRVLTVECWPSKSPVFLKDGKDERFYIRTGASTSELTGGKMQEYINQKFK